MAAAQGLGERWGSQVCLDKCTALPNCPFHDCTCQSFLAGWFKVMVKAVYTGVCAAHCCPHKGLLLEADNSVSLFKFPDHHV